jgi:hypothetical protein
MSYFVISYNITLDFFHYFILHHLGCETLQLIMLLNRFDTRIVDHQLVGPKQSQIRISCTIASLPQFRAKDVVGFYPLNAYSPHSLTNCTYVALQVQMFKILVLCQLLLRLMVGIVLDFVRGSVAGRGCILANVGNGLCGLAKCCA